MRLYIVRHGIAIDPTDPKSPADPKRALTSEGVKKTGQAMRGLRALGVEPEAMLTSPYVRAVQTAELAAEALGFAADKIKRTDALLPGTPPADLFRELAKLRADSVMCFGHAPHLDLAIAHGLGLRSPITELKKAGAACLELETLSPARGTLVWVFTSRALRLMGEA